MSIPWYTGQYEIPRALALRQRQLGPIQALAGAGGKVLGATRDRMAQESQDDATIAGLKAALGIDKPMVEAGAGRQPVDTSTPGHITEEALTPGATGPGQIEQQGDRGVTQDTERQRTRSLAEIDPTSDQGVMSRLADTVDQAVTPIRDAGETASDTVQSLAGLAAAPLLRIAKTGAIMTGLTPDTERGTRLREIGAFKGRQQREVGMSKLAAVLAARSGDPGAVLERLLPSAGVHKGEFPPAGRAEHRTFGDVLSAAASGDQGAEHVLKLLHPHRGGAGSPRGGVRAGSIEDLAARAEAGDEHALATLKLIQKYKKPASFLDDESTPGSGQPGAGQSTPDDEVEGFKLTR